MDRKIIFLFLCMFLFIGIVSAQPPFRESDTSVGLQIESGFPSTHKLNDNYFIHAHVYNATTGVLVNSGIECYYHFYNHQINGGDHISIGDMEQYGAGYNATVDGNLINQTGEYSALIWCNSTTEGGFFKYTFDATPTGHPTTTPNTLMYGIVLFFIFIVFSFSFYGFLMIPWGHFRGGDGTIIQVNNDRTKKIALFFLSYILAIVFLFIMRTMTESFMFLDDTPFLFDAFFMILLISIFPVIIAVIALWIMVTISDTKLQEAVFRGYKG